MKGNESKEPEIELEKVIYPTEQDEENKALEQEKPFSAASFSIMAPRNSPSPEFM